jgi:hypothetical protein
MDEDKKRTWGVGLGIGAPVLTVIGLLIGVWQFNQGEENKTKLENQLIEKRDKIEFQRKLWLERLSTYKSIAEQAGKIAATDKSDKRFKQYVQDFNASYWGMLTFVDDPSVEKAMQDFHVDLTDYQLGRDNGDQIKRRAVELVTECRKSVEPGTAP